MPNNATSMSTHNAITSNDSNYHIECDPCRDFLHSFSWSRSCSREKMSVCFLIISLHASKMILNIKNSLRFHTTLSLPYRYTTLLRDQHKLQIVLKFIIAGHVLNMLRIISCSSQSLQLLQEIKYTYIIGHYNPSVRIIDLVSHTTYVVCVNFMHKWRGLQFKVDSEQQIFLRNFSWHLITHRVFARNLLRRNRRRNTFRILF